MKPDSNIGHHPYTYVVQRARLSDNTLYGASHYSVDEDKTLCGQRVDYLWCVLGVVWGKGEATCHKCTEALELQTLKHSNP